MKKKLFKLSQTKLGELIVGIAFGKLNKLLPVEKVVENKYVLAFKHPKPAYKLHILLVPKKAIRNLSKLDSKDFVYIENIYKIIINGGDNQKVKQIHFHLISDL